MRDDGGGVDLWDAVGGVPYDANLRDDGSFCRACMSCAMRHHAAISRCFVFFRRDEDIAPYKNGVDF